MVRRACAFHWHATCWRGLSRCHTFPVLLPATRQTLWPGLASPQHARELQAQGKTAGSHERGCACGVPGVRKCVTRRRPKSHGCDALHAARWSLPSITAAGYANAAHADSVAALVSGDVGGLSRTDTPTECVRVLIMSSLVPRASRHFLLHSFDRLHLQCSRAEK